MPTYVVLANWTDQGIAGEYPGVGGPTLAQVQMVAGYLVGKDALQREAIYNDVKRGRAMTSSTFTG